MLVANWNTQKEGKEYFDTYALVARTSTVGLFVGLAPMHYLVIHQMDVQSAFLNGDLDEERYMKQHKGLLYHVKGIRCVS